MAFTAAVAFAQPAQSAEATPRPKAVQALFVIDAESGVVTSLGRNRIAVHLEAADHSTEWFADRPVRRGGQLPTVAFVNSWAKYGFVADPPNVTITYRTDNGRLHELAGVMRRPLYNPVTSTFDTELRLLPGFRAGADALGRASDVLIFVDDVPGVPDGALLSPADRATADAAYATLQATLAQLQATFQQAQGEAQRLFVFQSDLAQQQQILDRLQALEDAAVNGDPVASQVAFTPAFNQQRQQAQAAAAADLQALGGDPAAGDRLLGNAQAAYQSGVSAAWRTYGSAIGSLTITPPSVSLCSSATECMAPPSG